MEIINLIQEKINNGIAKRVAIKDILIRQSDLEYMLEEYHKSKLKLLRITDISGSLCDYCKYDRKAVCCQSCLDGMIEQTANTQ